MAGSGKVEPYARYVVKKLTLPTKPMSRSSTAVDQFLYESDRRVLTKQNGESFFYSGKELVPVTKMSDRGITLSKNMLSLVAILVVLLLPVVVWSMFKKRSSE
jgi:hypothetical protein